MTAGRPRWQIDQQEREFRRRQAVETPARELDVSPERVEQALEVLKARGLLAEI